MSVQGLQQTYPSTRFRLGRWLGVVLVLVATIGGLWAVVRYTDWLTRAQGQVQTITQGQLPGWMLQKTSADNGAVPVVAQEDPTKALRAEMARLWADLERERKAREALEAAMKQRAAPASVPLEKPKRERAKAVYVMNQEKPPAMPGVALYTLAVWEYIPCVLENVLSSEIPGMFTVKITRPVLDASRQHVLIPQGQRVGAKADTAHLLFGNERIPTFALSVRLPNGQALELGSAPIMDAAGTNGLTGEVDNHIWRLVWTSILIEGLRAGQQVLTQEIASQGDGVTVTGIGQYSSSLAQQRLGRAQDTRPTITAAAGEQCQILITKPMSLPSFAAVQH